MFLFYNVQCMTVKLLYVPPEEGAININGKCYRRHNPRRILLVLEVILLTTQYVLSGKKIN